MKRKMFLGASLSIFENAQKLRSNQTECESIIWDYLKQRPKGYKFRRQHPIKTYIADFYCHALKIIIEIDGDIHLKQEIQEHDIERQKYLEDEGIQFLRITNDEVKQNIEKIKAKIDLFIEQRKIQNNEE